MLIPKLLWPLLVYEICSTTVDPIEAKIRRFTRRFQGVPPGLTGVATYCRKTKLKLTLKSILEEYKFGKDRLLPMLEDPEDPFVKTLHHTTGIGKLSKLLTKPNSALKLTKSDWATQTDRKGLGSPRQSGCLKPKRNRKEMWSSRRYAYMKIPEGSRNQCINSNRNNELIGIMPHRNKSHGNTSGTWYHFGSAILSDQCTSSDLQRKFRTVGKEREPTSSLCQGRQTTEHV